MNKTKKQESGRSMVEMVGVLAIMGLITAGAFVLLGSRYRSQKRSRATDEIDLIASNVRAMGAQAENNSTKFDKLPAGDTDNGQKKGIALATALLDSADGATPFGGSYGAYQIDRGAKFAIKMIGIDASECEAMAGRQYKYGTPACEGRTVTITFTE